MEAADYPERRGSVVPPRPAKICDFCVIIQQSKGLSELVQPEWDKKLWDGSQAPNLRTVSTIAVAVAAAVAGTVVSGGTLSGPAAALTAAAISSSMTMGNELLFSALDLAGGYKTPAELGKNLAISAATSAVSALGGAAGAGLKEAGGIGGALARTAVTGAAGAASTTGAALLQNMNFSTGNFDGTGFRNTMGSMSTWTGTIASTLGFAVTNGLGLANLTDGNANMLNGRTFAIGNIASFNSFAGSMAGAAATYGMTGKATFNILDIADLGLKAEGKDGTMQAVHTGLLELTVGDGEDPELRLGTGGTNISYGTIAAAMSGMKEGAKVASWKYGGEEKRSTLNVVNMLGYTEKKADEDLAADIWSGKRKVLYDTMNGRGLGWTEGTTIHASRELLGGGNEGSGQLASILDHENAHMEGYEEMGARMSGYDTWNLLADKFKLTGAGYDGISDIAYLSNVLKNEGEQGLYSELFFGDAFNKSKDGKQYYYAEAVDPGWRQNEAGNKGITLGTGWADTKVREVNAVRLNPAWEKEKAAEYAAYKAEAGDGAVSAEEYEYTYKDAASFDTAMEKDKKLSNGGTDTQKLKSYYYDKVEYNDLAGYGCTLATAAYMAYSLTGNAVSLNEANETIKQKNLFLEDSNNGNQKNILGRGEEYAKVVNALAGKEVVKYVDTGSTVTRKNAKTGKEEVTSSTELEWKIRMYADSEDSYMSHVRLLSGHSVLLSDVDYKYGLTALGESLYGEGSMYEKEFGKMSEEQIQQLGKENDIGKTLLYSGLERRGVHAIETVDPWQGHTPTYTMDSVRRMDFFRALLQERRREQPRLYYDYTWTPQPYYPTGSGR